MRLRKFAVSGLFLFFAALGAHAQNKTVAERWGCQAVLKLRMVDAADLAVAHSVDTASFDALTRNAVNSASIMVPCAWLTEVAAFAKNHPEADLGLHLTLTSEWKTYRWGPVESKDKVPSLLDSAGYLWPESPTAASHIKPEEAEREIRTQIETAIAGGSHPTPLHSQLGTLVI